MRLKIKATSGIWNLESGIIAVFLSLQLVSCAGTQIRDGVTVNTIPPQVRQDLTVSGTIRVKGEVKVFRGATLTVKPGTRFLFEPYDPDNDGINDSRLIIEGVLVARGDPEAPIYFSSAASEPEPGDWLELRMDHSEGSVLEYCILEHSRYGLHVHFSSGFVMNSVFRDNIDGTRFGTSSFEFDFNLVRGNEGKGINLRDSRIRIMDNRIENNGHGIFMFEKAADSIIGFNLFRDNERSDIRFGDFYQGKAPVMMGNRKDDDSPFVIAGIETEIDPGKVMEGFPWSEWKPGPLTVEHHAKEMWKKEIGSFIDAAPVLIEPDHEKVAVISWYDGLVLLEAGTGAELTRVRIPDVTDATPEIMDEEIYFPSWDRTVRAVDVDSGEITGSATWDPSMADDHRQASPRATWTGLYMGLWNGDFRKLDPVTMEWTWSVPLDAPIRGAAALARDVIWVGTDGGSLYKISYEGIVLGRLELGSAVRAAPTLIGDDSLAVVTRDGILYRVQDSVISWRRKLPGPGTYARPITLWHHHDQIWVGDGSGTVSSFTGNGALIWRMELGSAVHTLTEPTYGMMFAGTQSTGVHIFTGTGRSLGILPAQGAVHGIALIERGNDVVVIFGARDGFVRAYTITPSRHTWEPPTS